MTLPFNIDDCATAYIKRAYREIETIDLILPSIATDEMMLHRSFLFLRNALNMLLAGFFAMDYTTLPADHETEYLFKRVPLIDRTVSTLPALKKHATDFDKYGVPDATYEYTEELQELCNTLKEHVLTYMTYLNELERERMNK